MCGWGADWKGEPHSREKNLINCLDRDLEAIFASFQNQMLQTRVIRPLQGLLDCFHGPTRLIQKRQDKHLDYSASLQKKEKNKDPSKSKVASDIES